ncbi:beta-ketoacyl-ACP synthase [Denitromonas halophila]|uniref:Beta-ketoacyl-ACP synthase n=1 Tax=Denitromonas halophila TaxID=1629404 RepID=A0A557QT63_9RHOO|nr:beta-ketoacyl-ACP synthase [Denitromonas halophila]TVO56100.1 beta-ketoacyl-ACP synthase [Denitromonas halophila]
MHRVVVTGMAGITSLGDTWEAIDAAMSAGRNGVRRMPEWDAITDLQTRLGAPVDHFQVPRHYPRKMLRSMGRVSLMSVCATERALAQAGLLDDPRIRDGRMGIAYGSSGGSVEPVRVFGQMLDTGQMSGVTATSYIQMMAHTTAVNIGLFFGLKGRVIPTSSACTSGSQGIGYAYEAIRYGKQALMIAGGAEELSSPAAAVFDTLFATSQMNDAPTLTPRPFDTCRDGLVVGEGAATLVLESYEHAVARGATILAEIVGFDCNSDGKHITQPSADTMATVMRRALADADLPPSAIDYISAHGTATEVGDIAESTAVAEVFGASTPISSLKGHFGHTLGACGAIEAWLGIEMMHAGHFAPNLNLDTPDPRCAALDYIMNSARPLDVTTFMSNNFAFGGINTSLIFKRHHA